VPIVLVQTRVGIESTPGFKDRLVNDVGERIENFKKAGYRIMEKPIREGAKDAADASQAGKVSSQAVGGGITAYYMEIPEDLYNKDQMDKQKEPDRIMSQIGHLDKVKEDVRRGEVVIEHKLVKE